MESDREDPPRPEREAEPERLAVVLTGGGARGAYQVGVLRALAKRFPQLHIPIIVGVSAGAVNAAHLAGYRGSLQDSVEALVRLWCALTPDQVFRVDAGELVRNVLRWGIRLISGGHGTEVQTRGLVETEPLRHYLEKALKPVQGVCAGIAENVREGKLLAVAIGATSYTTAQSVMWVQGDEIQLWERPQRRSIRTDIGVDHVMASAALPLLFPAVQVGNEWYGDGGIRLTAPLSPALHLGATKILVCSTRYPRSREEAARHLISGYPPPAQILGVLYNSVFLDLIDQDVMRLQRMNRVLERVPAEYRMGFRIIDMLVVRPSRDLGKLARDYETKLPRAFRFLTRGLGTRQTSSPDLLSLILFQGDYLRDLIELGEADGDARANEIAAFLEKEPRQ